MVSVKNKKKQMNYKILHISWVFIINIQRHPMSPLEHKNFFFLFLLVCKLSIYGMSHALTTKKRYVPHGGGGQRRHVSTAPILATSLSKLELATILVKQKSK